MLTTENSGEDAVRVGPGSDVILAGNGHVDIIDCEIKNRCI